ncbi:DNA damage-regulated autophagy modulator protein 2-like [Apostichopus japonicus]|uniref:DNA damage-regulated autophagy modulator protein 2-like n=1 Tax=Stichopus japonicus TaxID=307972 RepID=UPI003AB7130D
MAISIDFTWSPITAAIFLLAALFIPYIIGVCCGHVRAWFPYIHEIGADDPERCIFTALFNVVALLLFLNVREQQNDIYKQLRGQRSGHLDEVSFWCGALACLGLFIMANFPAIKKNKIPFFIHCGGAIMFFGGSLVYCGILSWFAYKEASKNDDKWVPFALRCLFLVLFVFVLLGYILFWYFGRHKPQKAMIKISALCEWLLVLIIIGFFLTLEFEYSNF